MLTDSSAAEDLVVTLDKLHRDYRLLKRERRKRQLYTNHCHDVVRKQRQEVDKLRRQRAELQKSLLFFEGVQDAQHTERLGVLLEMDELDRAVERERRRQAALEKETSGILRTLKKKEGTADRQSGRAGLNRKEILGLDVRLDLARNALDERATRNGRRRDELDILRKVRLHFRALHDRLDADLREVRREATELTDRANAAYEARVATQRKAEAMRGKEVREAAAYRAGMKEAKETLAHERRRVEFAKTKNRHRTDPGEEERGWVERGGDSAETLEEVFLRVRSVVNEHGLKPDRVVWRYVRGEEMNAELTAFIGDQTDEAEELKTHRGQVEAARRRMVEEDAEATRRHLALMAATAASQLDLDGKLKNVEFMLRATGPVLQRFKGISDSILTKVARREKKKLCEELGEESVTEEHLMSYMDLVEQKGADLLTWQASFV